MFLRFNTQNIQHKRNKIQLAVDDEQQKPKVFIKDNDNPELKEIVFYTSEKHNLKKNDKIIIKKNNDDKSCFVISENLGPYMFSVLFEYLTPIPVKEIVKYDETSIVYPYGELPLNVEEDTVFSIWTKDLGNYAEISGCVVLNKYAFSCSNSDIIEDEFYWMADNRFFNENGLKDSVEVLEDKEYINFSFPLSENMDNNLLHEETVVQYFNEKKNELIPEIIDYEKYCFVPTYKKNGKLCYADKLQFNLFFRDRKGNADWLTGDDKGWNQYPMDDNGNFPNTVEQKDGDLIGCLNFTDDDIYYRKKKVSKSFLRLSFYDSVDPSKQMLLFYSTIFLDSAELYDKYIANFRLNNKNISGGNYVNQETDKNNRLGTIFTVTDRYDKTKSSEGFYLYLFPDGLTTFINNNDDSYDGSNENIGSWDTKDRMIYMKVEFNHAGYGRTIPFMFPRSGGGILYDFGPNFPTSFNGDWKQCNEMQYFPVILNYDSELNEYVYYFPYGKTENNTLVFNLYEPRINSLE